MELDPTATAALELIDVPERCGNAPRKAIVRDLAIALVVGDHAFLEELFHANIEWTVNGDLPLQGIDAVCARVADEPLARKLEIFTVLTHGTECGVDGKVAFDDGSVQLFGHFLRFTGSASTAKVKSLRTYSHLQAG